MARERKDGSFGGDAGRKPGHAIDSGRESYVTGVPNDWGHDAGFRARRNGEWGIIELDPWADPRKTVEWARRTISAIGPQRFQREFMRNWSLSTQAPFFPEYSTFGGDDRFVCEFASVGNGPVALGLDFGLRRPALVALQGNARKTRLYVLREWSPINVHTSGAFREVCGWLVGELEEEQLSAHALIHVMDLKRHADKGGPAVPWFRGVRNIVRYTGPEALRTDQTAAAESAERRIVDQWASAGMPLSLQSSNVEGGTNVIRHLLRPSHSKWPYIMIDKSCTLLREAFNGGYTFRKPTRMDPSPTKPAKNGIHDNIMDALRYAAVALVDDKVVDGGDLEEGVATVVRSGVETVVEKPRTRDVYDRGASKDTSEGYGTLFGTIAEAGRSVYKREEY